MNAKPPPLIMADAKRLHKRQELPGHIPETPSGMNGLTRQKLDSSGRGPNRVLDFRRRNPRSRNSVPASLNRWPILSPTSPSNYSCLNRLNDAKVNICTVEDPVEYKFKGMNQVQVKAQVGLTFSSALRAFLRQDPDIIMVGEVRDQETAEICLRAALTGHFVLSTPKANFPRSASQGRARRGNEDAVRQRARQSPPGVDQPRSRAQRHHGRGRMSQLTGLPF